MITLNDSILALGSCLVGIGVVVTGLLALLFRHPNAPRWTHPEIVAMLICVPVAGAIGFGTGYIIYGLYQLAYGVGDPRELLVLGGVSTAVALLWRVLRIRQRLKDYAVATSHSVPGASLPPTPAVAIGEAPPAHGPAARRPGTLA